MHKADIPEIKELRNKTGAPLALCKEALDEAAGDIGRAREFLVKRGAEIQEKRALRETHEGRIDAYIHPNAKIGAMVELKCETDFVSRSEEFRELAHNIAMQIAASDPEELADNDIEKLLEQSYIKNPAITLGDYFQETVTKLKENIQLIRFVRYTI